jgi:hypothetical protein
MKVLIFTTRYILLILIIVNSTFSFAQTPWSGVYGNEWLTGKYEQSWLRIGVKQNGIQRITLPAGFTNKPTQLHLYHRGKEVSLISASNTEIEFYGIVNDGASDALLYRPYTGVKQNPYYSWYSDESAYFLTFAAGNTAKMAVQQTVLPVDGEVEPFHLQKDLTVFSNSDTYDGSQNIVLHSLDQSYFIEGKGRSGRPIYKLDNYSEGKSIGDPKFPFSFNLKNLTSTGSIKPKIEMQLNGRTNTNNQIKVSLGQSTTKLVDIPGLVQFSGFIPYNITYDINASDVDASGNGVFQLESTKITSEASSTGVFSINYVSIKYPQSFDMSGVTSKTLNLTSTSKTASRISIPNAPTNARILDITDVENPRIISGNNSGNVLTAMVQRVANQELNLYVSNAPVANTNVTSVTFSNYIPADKDFLIVSNEVLAGAATEYAKYRSSVPGGSYRVLPVKIKDIYNQFNYGEPGPVAIRRFVDYMLKAGVRKEHNLLLMGHSTTLWNQMVRELPGEVPAIGFPGSDVLLVEGLAGTATNVPAIPIGRISATTEKQVLSYLQKVKVYESSTEYGWKKRVLHLSGGHSGQEISQFASDLNSLTPLVQTGEFGGHVTPFVKQSAIETIEVNITPEVNQGVGWISYYGHGSSTITDYDLGYISDPARGYNNNQKSPFLYFNGCGVGNIFNGRNNTDISASDKLPLSSDWINNTNGSIGIIANTYYSFLASSSNYLNELYNQLFVKKYTDILSIGEVQKRTAQAVISKGVSEYDIANIHQSLLQGDPAIKVIRTDAVDYEVAKLNSLYLVTNEAGKTLEKASGLKVGVILANNGKYVQGQKLTIRINLSHKDGTSEIQNFPVNSIPYKDTLFFDFVNSKALSKIQVIVDPENAISEMNENNNNSELSIDWEVAKNLTRFPIENFKDLIPPVMQVYVNGLAIVNEGTYTGVGALKVVLTDNSVLSPDSSLINLFIKPCTNNSCEFQRISYSSLGAKIYLDGLGNLVLEGSMNTLKPGVYQLMIQSADAAGNTAQSPYNVKITVESKAGNQLNLVVSPNPFTDYVRFQASNISSDNKIESVEIKIFDQGGVLVYSGKGDPQSSAWYWVPAGKNGLYIYDFQAKMQSGEVQKFKGKIAMVQ